MIWKVSNSDYPKYDKASLYNTNPSFDDGPFKALEERHQLESTKFELFAYKFDQEGVYVFTSSKNPESAMLVRVMAKGAQCAEDGPFFATTPRIVIQNGIAISRDIVIMPDWVLIGAMLGSFGLLMLILLIGLLIFRKHGWKKVTFKFPRYRVLAQRYNFDDYSSKGSTVHPAKKYHRNLEAQNQYALEGPLQEQGPAVDAEVKGDEFWDYDQQVDLEGFTSGRFYGILAKQSRDITGAIARQKDQAKQLYQKINQQTESLKGLWIAKLNLRGRSAMATPDDLRAFEAKKAELEAELERRKELGFNFQQILQRQKAIVAEDEEAREAHLVAFEASMREAIRSLKSYSENRSKGDMTGDFDEQLQHRVGSRVDAIIQRLSVEIQSECQRRGTWALLGDVTGARLCTIEGNLLGLDYLFHGDGTIRATDIISQDTHTGLLIPNPQTANMLLADNVTNVPVPPNFFVHQNNGRVMPIEGNVSYDPLASRLTITADSTNADAASSAEALIPYIPYPNKPETGVPVKTSLTPVEKRGDMRLNGRMICGRTGLPVPILGMTIHPETGNAYPIGGCHPDPVTGLPVAIELGSMMLDPNTGRPAPIVAVTIDPRTGNVIPLGGTPGDSDRGDEIPVLLGDSFTEPLSGRPLKATSARLVDDGEEREMEPMGGGYQYILDVGELYYEYRVLDALEALKEAVTGPDDLDGRQELSVLETAQKDLQRGRSKVMTYILRNVHDIMRREERCSLLAESGGSPGMYEFSATGQLLPILVGTTMRDPSGTDFDVPILGIDKNHETDTVIPLGGSLEDPGGEGLVPIMIGEKAVDPVTGALATICGVKMNQEFGVTEPVTLSSSSHRKRRPPPGSIALLEEELAGRRSFWRRQRHREDELTEVESNLYRQLLEDEHVTAYQVHEKLENIKEETVSLADAAHREIQRRTEASVDHAAGLPPDIVAVLTMFDALERHKEESHNIAHKRFADAITRFFDKLQTEETKYNNRMEELQGALNPEAEGAVTERFQQAKARLRGELQDQLQSRMEQLDEEHSTLEYVRNKAEISALEAKLILTGGAVIAGEYEVALPGIYGDDLPLPESNRELLPLLQRLIRLLEEGMPVLMNSAGQVVGGGYSVLGGGAKFDVITASGAAAGASGTVTAVAPAVVMSPTSVTSEKTQQASALMVAPQRRTMGTTISATEILSKVEVGQMGEKFSSEAVNIAEIAASGGLTEEKRKEITKNLMEKHTLECAQLENELRTNEIKVISEVIQAYEERKSKAIADLQEELKERIRRAESEEEKEALVKEYSDKMAAAQDDIEQQKQKKLRDVRKRLKEERKRRKKELYNRHKEEARVAGISDVVDLDLPDEDELDRELILLAQQQEKLLAELLLAYEQESEREREELESGRRDAFDKEMEARVRAMNLSVAPEEVEGAFEEVRELHSRAASRRINMKEKMKERKDRKRSKKTEEDLREELKHVPPGSPEEAEIRAALERRKNADMRREQAALLAVLSEVEAEQEDMKRKQVVQNLLKKTEMTEEEQKQIVAKYMEEAEEMKERYSDMQKHSRAVLVAKLAARRRLKEEMRKEQAMKKELKEMSKKQAELSGDQATLQVLQAAEAQVSEEVNNELELLAEQQIEQQIALEVKQAEEMLVLEDELKNEEISGGQQVVDQIDEQKLKLIAAKKETFEKEMSRKRDDLSKEQADVLLEQHKQELEFLSRSMEVEKQRQLASLGDKIAERKKRKAAALQQRHKAEMAKEMMNQQDERQKAEDGKIREAQKSALINVVQNLDSEQAGNTIYQVLQQRHMNERVQLEGQFNREIDAAKAEARAQIAENRQAEREEMVAEQEKEFMELIAKSNSMTTAELSQKKAELKLQHKKQLAQFDTETQQKVAQAEMDTVPSLEVKHAHARLELREKQLLELAGTMSDLSTEEELIKNYTEEAERASQAAKEYRDQTIFEMAERINRIKAERQQQSEEQKKKMDEEVKRLEAELEKEREREELRLAEREAERATKRVKLAQEAEAAKQLAMAQRGMTEDEKEKLMREHEENMAKFETNLKKEQERTKAALREKLEARRKKKKEDEMKKIKATAKAETEAAEHKEREEMTALQKQEAELLRASTPAVPRAPSDTRKKATEELPITEGLLTSADTQVSAGATPVITAGLPEGVSEQDWVSMLIGSPIFDSVNEIENMLKNNIGEGGVAGAKGGRPYIDIKDAQWRCRGDLVPVDINELSPANFVVYRFGVFITQMLQKAMDAPEVTLLLASNLPPNNYERNAFRNSFFYEHARRVLFVRQERMESVGDFLVVIMHALSHIKIDDLVDDQNPLFLREFYKAFRICCQDLFFARSRNTPTAQGLAGSVSSASPLEAAFKPARSMTERVNVVGELVNIKVSSPVDTDFSIQGITERLARKNAFLTRAKLKEYLSSAHAPSSRKEEFAMTRLKELRGEKTGEEKRPKSRTAGVKSGLKSPKELLETQINDLEGRVDTLNSELAQVLKTESNLNFTINEMEHDSNISEDRLQVLRQQLSSAEQRKDNLLNKVDYLEEEIIKKTKELKALK